MKAIITALRDYHERAVDYTEREKRANAMRTNSRLIEDRLSAEKYEGGNPNYSRIVQGSVQNAGPTQLYLNNA